MSDREKAIEAFRLFNKKADDLTESTFVKKMFEEESGVSLSWARDDAGTETTNFERRGPDKEAIKAFILDYRFFIQDNERSSLRNMAERYQNAPISETLKKNFDSARNELNSFLDAPPNDIQLEYNGERLTRRKIIDTFVYGGLAHANREKEQLFEEWKSVPPFFPMIENEFVYILAQILDVIVYIKGVSEAALGELE